MQQQIVMFDHVHFIWGLKSRLNVSGSQRLQHNTDDDDDDDDKGQGSSRVSF